MTSNYERYHTIATSDSRQSESPQRINCHMQDFPNPTSNSPASIPVNSEIEEERPRRHRPNGQPTTSSLAHMSDTSGSLTSLVPTHPSLQLIKHSSLSQNDQVKPPKNKRVASLSFEDKKKKRSATPKSIGDTNSVTNPPLMVKKKIKPRSLFKNESILDGSTTTSLIVPNQNVYNDVLGKTHDQDSNSSLPRVSLSEVSDEDERKELLLLQDSLVPIAKVPVIDSELLIATPDLKVASVKQEQAPSPTHLDIDQKVLHCEDLICLQEIDIFGLENPIDGADIPPITPIQLSSTKFCSGTDVIKSGIEVFQEAQSREKLREQQIGVLEKRVEDLDKQVECLVKQLKDTEEGLQHAIKAINSMLEKSLEDSSSSEEGSSSTSEEHSA
ncbi:hypothetical protein DFH28DRAFT_1118876 [Melampsora americana]|nr:hypothetical protein DFH28DRAFT_1118876 [Melampsora americana]